MAFGLNVRNARKRMESVPHTNLSHFKNIFPDETFYVVGCGPSLWNWARDKGIFWNHPTIFINSSIHFMGPPPDTQGKYPENIFRIIMDVKAVDDYQNTDYYKRLRNHRIPNVHTFVSLHMIEALDGKLKAKINALDFTCYYIPEEKIIPLADLKENYLWGPTLFSAISLAVFMGAKEIRLAGVDYGCSDVMSHWDRSLNEKNAADPEAVNAWGCLMASDLIFRAGPYVTAKGVALKRFIGPRKVITLRGRAHG